MSQHDMDVANQGFPAFRNDMNAALVALATLSSGASSPSTTYANQLWLDTSASPAVLKMRNSGNTAWIVFATIDLTNGWLTRVKDDLNRPSSLTGGGETITTNYSNGGHEVDYWNVFNSATTSFSWKQKTGAGTHQDLLTLAAGGNTVGSPTGGAKGAGSLNAEALYVNGAAVLQPSFRNMIRNGEMAIAQRTLPMTITASAASYTFDGWVVSVTAGGGAIIASVGSGTLAAGTPNNLALQVSTARTPISTDVFAFYQSIEGLLTARLGWGTAAAKSAQLSFMAQSSVAGTYAVALKNSATNRSYVATFALAANTPTQVGLTIPGDTSGTWLTNTGAGISVVFDLGSGTNFNTTAGAWQAGNFQRTSACVNWAANASATFNITNVQLEEGSIATPFERRSFPVELAICQRYLEPFGAQALGFPAPGGSYAFNYICSYKVTKRATPTVTLNVTAGVNLSGTSLSTNGLDGFTMQAIASVAGNTTFTWQPFVTSEL